MAIVGSIVIGMSAQTDKLEKALARAEKSLISFGASGKKDVAEGLDKLKVGSLGVAANLASLAGQASRAAATSRAIRAVGEGFALMGTRAAAAGRPLAAATRPVRELGATYKQVFHEVRDIARPVTDRMGKALLALRFSPVTRGLATLGPGFRVAAAGAGQLALGLGKLATIPATKAIGGLARGLNALPSVVGAAAKGLAGVGVAAAVGLGGLAAAQADVIDRTGDVADRLGTTTAALSELRYAAQLTGSEGEALEGALQKMNVKLAEAASQAGGPADLAFRRLGLDAGKLAALDPTEAFRRISAGFQSIPTDAEKARVAMDVFGKSGTALLNTINAGPEDLERLSDEFRRMGGSVSEVQRQQVGAMFDSLDRVKSAVAGVGTQLAVGLSPFVQAAAEEFVSLATSGDGMSSLVGQGLESVARGIGVVADAAQWVKVGFVGLQAVGAEWSLGLVSAAEAVGKSLEKVVNLLPGVHVEFTAGITTLREELEHQAVKAGEALDRAMGEEAWSAKVERGFRRITQRSKEMAQAVAKSGGEAKKAADGFQVISDKASESASKRAISSFASDAHAIWESTRSPLDKYEEQVEKIRRSLRGGAIDEGTASEAMKNARNELKGSLGVDLTPWEKYREKLKDIREAVEGGAIDDKTAALATKRAGKELGDLNKPRFAGALEVGSAEYRSAVLAATSGRAEGFDAVQKNTATSARANQEMVGLLRQFINTAGAAPTPFEMT